jgi:hypothetical protein
MPLTRTIRMPLTVSNGDYFIHDDYKHLDICYLVAGQNFIVKHF